MMIDIIHLWGCWQALMAVGACLPYYIFLCTHINSPILFKEVNEMTLIERCQKMIDELSIPTTKFCKHIGVAPSSFYAWRRDIIKFSDKTLKRIDEYLSKYGF